MRNFLRRYQFTRRTFKILYRDHGVDEKSIDALVCPAEGDKMRKAYAGVGVPKRYDNLRLVEHPWLKAKPKYRQKIKCVSGLNK